MIPDGSGGSGRRDVVAGTVESVARPPTRPIAEATKAAIGTPTSGTMFTGDSIRTEVRFGPSRGDAPGDPGRPRAGARSGTPQVPEACSFIIESSADRCTCASGVQVPIEPGVSCLVVVGIPVGGRFLETRSVSEGPRSLRRSRSPRDPRGFPRPRFFEVALFLSGHRRGIAKHRFCGLTQRRRDAKDLSFPASLRLCVRIKIPEIPVFSAAPRGISHRQDSRFGLPPRISGSSQRTTPS
jgi:hypothetical protein